MVRDADQIKVLVYDQDGNKKEYNGSVVGKDARTDVAVVRRWSEEDCGAVGGPACCAGFERELDLLPGEYAPPDGRLFLALQGGKPAGCAALRRIEVGTGEMKRLYVRPAFRGSGAGRALALEVIATARNSGYVRLMLDTLPSMTHAQALYRSLGFRPVGPYLACPTPGASCYELRL